MCLLRMPTSRLGRNLRRYLPFVCVVVLILVSQGFLGYNLYSLQASYNAADRWTDPNSVNPENDSSSRSLTEDEASHGQNAVVEIRGDCVLNGTDIRSALSRVKTAACRDELIDTYCKHQKYELYFQRLESSCPYREDAQFLGCFEIKRLDDFREPHFVVNNSKREIVYEKVGDCLEACITIGRALALYNQTMKQCFCSNEQESAWEENRCVECAPRCLEAHSTGLRRSPFKTEETHAENARPARIVFLLTVNGRAFRQIKRLVRAIDETSSENHLFFVHVDQRQDYLYRKLKELEKPNKFVVTSKRFSTIWGGTTLLQMLLSCFEEILSFPGWSWDYVINLSETDFPLRRIDELEVFLGANNGFNFVRSHGPDTPKFISKQALLKTFHECENRMWKLGDRSLPRGIQFDGGSDWISLHREFVEWLIKNRYNDELLMGLERLYRQSLLPAESFFHSVLLNSRFCSRVINNNLRYVNWRRKQGCKCQYKHIVDWCGCSPNVILEDDFPKLQSMRNKSIFFARKFEPVIDQTVIDSLEEKLTPRRSDLERSSSQLSYWQNEFDVNDISPTNEGKYAAWTSLGRLATKHLSQMGSRCVLRNVRLLEAWLYFYEENFKGVIVQFEAHAEHIREPVKTEVLMRPITSFERSGNFQNDPFDERLQRIEVSSEFDMKELIFRNFAGILSTQDDFGVLHEWDSGPAGAVTFVWIDPAQEVAGSYEVQISKSRQTQHHKPPLKKPIRPGKWTVQMFLKWILMAQSSFIVLPQTHKNRSIITDPELAQRTNSGPTNGYTDSNLSSVQEFLKISAGSKAASIEGAALKSRRVSTELEEWTDVINVQRWSLEHLCFVSNPLHVTGGVYCPQLSLDPCHYTSWSSLAADDKAKLSI